MKKIYILFALAFSGSLAFAQAPNKMSYQAVIRNTGNNLVTSSPVGMQLSILQGTPTGTPVYIERQTPNSNTNGLVSIEVGNGTVISGNFGTIDWTNGPYFIKTETDPNGGTNYTITGTSQLLSVPYALHAQTAENVPTNVSALTNDAGYITSEVDGSVTNELQTISRTGTIVTLTDGGSYTDSVNTYTAGAGINIAGNVISTNANTIGDVKQGYQSGDHNGWYLLDGRALTALPVIAQSNASLLGITVNLPNAANRFLADMGAPGAVGGSNTITLAQSNLPNVNFTGTTGANGLHTHDVDPASTSTSSNGAHNHDFKTAPNDAGDASSQGFPGTGHNAMRTTDRIGLVIDNSIIQQDGAHTHTLDIGNTTSTSAGSHTHTVSLSSGGTGVAINSTPSFLSVNAFIYLGQ
jgi:hypothetical protein